MMQTALRAYNASSRLISSAKSTFIENPKARKVKRVGMVNLYRINGIETQGLSITELKTPHHSVAQDQQYKIVFHARHKLRAPLIRSRIIRQSSCIDSILSMAVVTHPFSLYLIWRSALGMLGRRVYKSNTNLMDVYYY